MGTTHASQSLLTSARTTGQTVLDSDGNLKWALHNLVVSTDLSDSGVWGQNFLDSVTESGTSPSGKAAYLVTESTANNVHGISDALSFTAGETYSFVIDVKANGRTEFAFQAPSGVFGATVQWDFDLSAVTATQTTAGTKDSGSITLISAGWYRCVMTADATASTSGTVALRMLSSGSTVYVGDGTSGLYLSRPRVYRSAIHSPSELVTNGTFDSDITGWTLSASTPPTWDVGGYMQFNSNGSTFSDADQSFTTVAGGVYTLSVELVANASFTSTYVGTSQGGNDLLSEDFSTLGVHTYTFTATGTTTWLRFRDGSGAANQQIDNVSVYQVLDSGMQNGSDGTDYVETSGSAVYHAGVAYDGSGACLGMQSFEGRTNYAVPSNEMASSTGITAADVSDAELGVIVERLTKDATDPRYASFPNALSVTSSTDYVASRFFKHDGDDLTVSLEYNASPDFDLSWSADFVLTSSSITPQTPSSCTSGYVDYGNGWYRVWAAFTSGALATGSNPRVLSKMTGGAGSVLTFGGQLEVGTFLTPYIPTDSAAVVRGADSVSLTVADFGFNATEGTVLVTGQTLKADETNNTVWSLVGAGSDNMNSGSRVGGTAVGTYTTWVQDDGVTEALMNSTSVVTDGENFNAAAAYKEDNFGQSGGGQTVVTDTSGTIPTVTTLKLGNGTYGHLNGYIKSLAYYPVRLADATLEAESA